MRGAKTSTPAGDPSPGGSRNAILLYLFLATLLIRVAGAFGESLHFDEPYWLLRGDFLLRSAAQGDWEALQESHWTIADRQGGSKVFRTREAAGIGTAILTGLGRVVTPAVSFDQEIDGVAVEIFFSRLLHALCSVATPFVLLFLCRGLGLPWAGQLSLLFFLIFETVIVEMGSLAHLESLLTLTVPLSILLYVHARGRQSLPLAAAAGVIFGVAFSNRINAGIVVAVVPAYASLRLLLAPGPGSTWLKIRAEILRLLVFGLAGWVVFVLLFPPLWNSPILGFFDFLYQHAAMQPPPSMFSSPLFFLAESKLRILFLLLGAIGLCVAPVRSSRLFQAGLLLFVLGLLVVTLPGRFYPRYLSSSLPGLALAGSCTFAFLWNRWGRTPVYLGKLGLVVLLVLTSFLAARITTKQWARMQQTRNLYGQLYSREFARIDAPDLGSTFRRVGSDPVGPALSIRSSLVHLHLLYLNVLLTDQDQFRELRPNWTRKAIEPVFRCRGGNWRMADANLRNRERPGAIRSGRSIAWPCRDPVPVQDHPRGDPAATNVGAAQGP